MNGVLDAMVSSGISLVVLLQAWLVKRSFKQADEIDDMKRDVKKIRRDVERNTRVLTNRLR